MSMSQKRKVKELEAKVDQIMEYLESQSQSQSESPSGKDQKKSFNGGFQGMADEKPKNKKTTKAKKKELLPFDELPIVVKRNRKLLYEYIRTGELP